MKPIFFTETYKMNRRAFTLIELLGVIAMVGILVAILIPSMGKAREAGRRAGCASNLMQIGMAWSLYLDDHDEKFPDISSKHMFGGWKGLTSFPVEARPLNPYLDVYSENDKAALEVFHCPSDIVNRQLLGPTPATLFNFWGNSYAVNTYLTDPFADPPGTPLSSIVTPFSKLALTTDRYIEVPGTSVHGGTSHNVELNVLFLDGHVGLHDYDADWDSGQVIWGP